MSVAKRQGRQFVHVLEDAAISGAKRREKRPAWTLQGGSRFSANLRGLNGLRSPPILRNSTRFSREFHHTIAQKFVMSYE
jgi:hypothetical protein